MEVEVEGGKGERTRARILAAALGLFAERGYDETSMKDIAEGAGVSVGLAYRYFTGKDALIVGYYEQLSDELGLFAAGLPKGSVSTRYSAVIRYKLSRLQPYRRALKGLAALAIDTDGASGVMSAATARIRARNARLYLELVRGSKDCPWGSADQSLARVLYVLDLLMVLAWIQDRSPHQRATGKIVDLAEAHLKFLPTTLLLPPVRSVLAAGEPILSELLGLDTPHTEVP